MQKISVLINYNQLLKKGECRKLKKITKYKKVKNTSFRTSEVISPDSLHKERMEFWRNEINNFEECTLLISDESKEDELGVLEFEFEKDLIENFSIENYSIDKKNLLFLLYSYAMGIYLQKCSGKDLVCFGISLSALPLILQLDEQKSFRNNFEHVVEKFEQVLMYKEFEEECYKGVTCPDKMFDVSIVCDAKEEDLPETYFESHSSQNMIVHIYSMKKRNVKIWYRKSLLSEEQVSFIHNHIKNLVISGINDDSISLASMNPIGTLEKKMILEDFNHTTRDYERKTAVELFELQADQYPEKTAVLLGNEAITYGELNKRSNQLAYKLRELGIVPNDFVAILAERSIEMIIGIIGILKSGGAYVPIDPSYPENRIQYILSDCSAKVYLHTDKVVVKDYGVPQVNLNSYKEWRENQDNPVRVNQPGHLAYLIYTSGTTGKPKGVMIEHQNLVNLVQAYTDVYSMIKDDVVLQFASISFDQSVLEIFNTLLIGASLCLLPTNLVGDVGEMEKYIIAKKVTWLGLTPALLTELDPTKFTAVRLLESGGAAADIDILEKWREKALVFNTYGPTETTVNATSFQYEKPLNRKRMPIGRPMPNSQVYILKDHQLCGIGIPGELCIAGRGVGRGYLNRPELTKEKFIQNPFGEGRLYRSGDLAKWLPDGNIEYLGRIDEQVKIRGFRIELGEIESVMRAQEGIAGGCVIVREDAAGDAYLCAYYIADSEIDIENTKSNMKKEVPYYMVPAQFIRIDKIPLTTNGKVDRRKLMEYEVVHKVEYIGPKNKIQQMVQEIFQEVLGINRISIYDNFFELGGHSLKAARLINLINERIKYRFTLEQIFSNPTIDCLSQVLEMSKDSNRIFIPKASIKNSYPLTPVQKGIYFVDQMDSMGTSYNISEKLALTGDLDVQRMKSAFSALGRLHSILRIGFVQENGEPVQIISDYVDLVLEYKITENKSIDTLFHEFKKPFDISSPPLIRGQLLKVAKEKYFLFVEMHHIISDGTSMELILKDLADLYNGMELEAQAIQYMDYSEWFTKNDLSSQKSYWINQYTDEIPVLEMPTDFLRPQIQSFKGKTLQRKIGGKRKEDVADFARKTGTTEYMVFLSALMIMLAKYGRQESVIVGSPFSGRVYKETEQMVGMFVNTLAIKGEPEQNKSFRAFLEEIKQSCLSAYENQEYSFTDLVECVLENRDFSRNPLFDVMFAYQSFDLAEFSFQNVKVERFIESESDTSKFDLSIDITSVGQEYILNFEYCTDLYLETSINIMIDHFLELIVQAVSHPDFMIGQLNMINGDERDMVIDQFNQTFRDYPRGITAIDMFEAQADKTPDKIAVIYEDQSITYKQLNQKANVIAKQLKKMGIESEDFVALFPQRSIEMIIAIWGILKAGAAYVPIDPSYPDNRVRYILDDCEAKAIVVVKEKKPESADIPALYLASWEQIIGEDENPDRIAKPDSLAYLIYTSGTTGDAKGVAVEHRNLVNLVHSYEEIYQMTEKDTVLQFASISFDQSVWDIFNILLIGGCLCLMPYYMIGDVHRLEEYIVEKRITIAALTPAFMKVLDINKLSGLRLIESGGAEAEAEILGRWLKSGKTVFNTYGPTETCVNALSYELRELNRYQIPIGRPIPNTQVYILNGDQLCGVGVPGELCIAGAGVARGYFKREKLTREKFIDNPFGTGKLYRSGDLARWMIDGNVEYMGRIDEQVKIRGFRIELGEVEYVLRKQEGVRDAVVIVCKDNNQEDCLCGFIAGDSRIDYDLIKSGMKKDLPEYMVPSYLMYIEKIPVNKNGKVDRKALPQIEFKSTREYIKPVTTMERKIADIFAAVLGVGEIGLNDDFFELGGHSLKAIRLLNMLEEETTIKLSIRQIFQYSTVGMLSKLAEDLDANNGDIIENIPKSPIQNSYIMSAAQRRMFLLYEMENSKVTYNMPESMALMGRLDIERLRNAYQSLINRHEILRTSFHVVDDQFVQIITDHLPVDIEIIEESRDNLALQFQNFIRPFELSTPYLIRLAVLCISETESVLFLDMHHIISDAVSIDMIWKELSELYNGKDLAPLQLHYKDYSEWAGKIDLTSQKDFWCSQFKQSNGFSDIPVLDLPLDFNRKKNQDRVGCSFISLMGLEVRENIEKFAKQHGATEYMVLLSVLMITLSRYGRQQELIIGSPSAGRTHKDTENMLGLFVNTLAMKGRPADHKTYTEFLSEIKEFCLAAYENQDYPFEELVSEVIQDRDISRNPLFDVMFVMKDKEDQILQFDQLSIVKHILPEPVAAAFDLTVNIAVTEEGYEINYEYCSNLFLERTIEQISKHYQKLLEEVIKAPDCQIGQLNDLSDSERTRLLQEFNQTDIIYSSSATIVELFESAVQKNGEKPAIILGEQSISYNQLNVKANQLADRLLAIGVCKEDFVALSAEREIETFIGMLGILKAGGAFVPMDFNHPGERIKYMLKDCLAKVIVTGKKALAGEFTQSQLNLYQSDSYTGDGENRPVISSVLDLAYLIYTSGTTGKPKGVMVEHQGVANLLEYFKNVQQITDQDRVLQFANLAFDASISEITMSLLCGGTLYLIPDEARKDMDEFENFINQNKITALILPPQYALQASLKGVRRLITAGSEASIEMVERFKTLKYSNDYGPTEATVCATHWDFQMSEIICDRVPIGKPIGNKKIYILQNDRLCGIGMPGELCITGVGLARGYLNNPVTTEEKFVKNPFGKGRMYRSGDLARWLPDGNIEFLGRIDEQVKIRGYRIELKEVETVLQKQKGVEEAAVISRIDQSGENQIYAYFTGIDKLEISEIREGILTELPDYMVPGYFMQIEKIPLNQSGKVDKKALPDPVKAERSSGYRKSENRNEERIAEVFELVLGFEKIGTEDNFFELGGDSIKAIRIVSKLREYGIGLNVKDIISGRTIHNIAKCVQVEKILEYPQEEVWGEVPMLPIQKAFFEQWCLTKPDHFNQAIMLKTRKFDTGALHKVLDKLICHHDMLRAIYQQGSIKILRSEENRGYDFTEIDIKLVDQDKKQKYVFDECTKIQQSINLETGPLVKTAIFKDNHEEHLLICIHHIAVDWVSLQILQEDLELGYEQYLREGKITLPKKTISYPQWASEVKAYGQSRELLTELDYWNRIRQETVSLGICKNIESDINGSETITFMLDQAKTNELLFDASKTYQTETMDLLLTALGIAANTVFSSEQITVQIEGHGREELSKPILADRTVGWFTAVYPIILRSDGNIENGIINTKEMLRKVPGKGMGFGILVENHLLNWNHQTEITFNYLGGLAESPDHVCSREGTSGTKDGLIIETSQYDVGEEVAKENVLPGFLQVNGGIVNGCLEISLTYDCSCFTERLIKEFTAAYEESLVSIINFCKNQTQSYQTISDFSNADMDQDDISAINDLIFGL